MSLDERLELVEDNESTIESEPIGVTDEQKAMVLSRAAPAEEVHCSTWCYSDAMTEMISQRELRNDSGRIMRGLDEGRTYIVTRNSQPVGELRPLRRQRFVDAGTVSDIFRNAPALDQRRFRDEVDAPLDQDVDPRD